MPPPLSSPDNTVDSSVFRAALRSKCLTEREAIDSATHAELSLRLQTGLEQVFKSGLSAFATPSVLAFCLPLRNEFDARPLVRNLIAQGWCVAVPVVLALREPMIYRAWTPDAAMTTDACGLAVPLTDDRVSPKVVLLPMVAFDNRGYRLGYGGGYFDRTLAKQVPQPFSVGVGFELGRVATILPQAHDIRLSAMVTEASVVYYDGSPGGFAEPI